MKKIQQAIYILGGILLVAGAALYITRWAWVPYMYITGSFMFAAMQMLDRYTGKNLVLRRLRRQQLLGAINHSIHILGRLQAQRVDTMLTRRLSSGVIHSFPHPPRIRKGGIRR